MQSGNHVEPGFMRLKQILKILPIGASSFWAGVRAGKYPAPIKLGPGTTVWKREAIFEFVRAVETQAPQMYMKGEGRAKGVKKSKATKAKKRVRSPPVTDSTSAPRAGG